MPEVEVQERMIGRFTPLQAQEPDVAAQLATVAFRRVVGAGVDNEQAGKHDLAFQAVDRVHDLLVNPPLETDVGPVAEDLAVVDSRQVEGASQGTP